jgi:prepilin-type N-terminal cleavage/methylation domain-containing protein
MKFKTQSSKLKGPAKSPFGFWVLDFGFPRKGFTLIELLVTMAIIAIIAALLIGGITLAMEKGQRARAKSEMSTIVSAMKAFRAEYSYWPCPRDNGWPDNPYGSKNMPGGQPRYNNEIIDVLRARDGGYNLNNSNNLRKIVFLEVPSGSLSGSDQRGTPTVYTEGEGYFLDPWGEPYLLFMDTDFDGELGMSSIEFSAAAQDLQTQLNVRVFGAVYVVPSLEAAAISYGPTPNQRGSAMFSWVE